jgi:hypothetical protein
MTHEVVQHCGGITWQDQLHQLLPALTASWLGKKHMAVIFMSFSCLHALGVALAGQLQLLLPALMRPMTS